jgi:molybdopterin-biosynthesis enzyme MoeA-like protein
VTDIIESKIEKYQARLEELKAKHEAQMEIMARKEAELEGKLEKAQQDPDLPKYEHVSVGPSKRDDEGNLIAVRVLLADNTHLGSYTASHYGGTIEAAIKAADKTCQAVTKVIQLYESRIDHMITRHEESVYGAADTITAQMAEIDFQRDKVAQLYALLEEATKPEPDGREPREVLENSEAKEVKLIF